MSQIILDTHTWAEIEQTFSNMRTRMICDSSLAFDAMELLGRVLQYQGKYDEAETMNRRALEGYEKVLGSNHPDTLTSVSNLALVLQGQGKYDEAEEMNRRALEGREKELGLNHPDTLSSVYWLAYLLDAQDEYQEALAHYHQASSGFAKILGPDHPTTLACQKHEEILLKSVRAESSSGDSRTSD